MEKFAIRKAERFLDQGNRLLLPALELIYAWNGFRTLGKSWGLVEPVYVIIEDAIKETDQNKGNKFCLAYSVFVAHASNKNYALMCGLFLVISKRS